MARELEVIQLTAKWKIEVLLQADVEEYASSSILASFIQCPLLNGQTDVSKVNFEGKDGDAMIKEMIKARTQTKTGYLSSKWHSRFSHNSTKFT